MRFIFVGFYIILLGLFVYTLGQKDALYTAVFLGLSTNALIFYAMETIKDEIKKLKQ